MRAALIAIATVAALTAAASAQVDAPGSFPIFSAPLDRPQNAAVPRPA